MDEAEDHTSKPIDDPEHLVSLLNKYVKVNLIKNISFEGFVNCVDPITESVIISRLQDNSYEKVLIPGEAIINISVLPQPEVSPPHPQKMTLTNSTEITLERKGKLISWLKSNLLPVTEEGDNIVVGSVNVMPPYGEMNIYAENPMIAMHMRNLIERMPIDFQSEEIKHNQN